MKLSEALIIWNEDICDVKVIPLGSAIPSGYSDSGASYMAVCNYSDEHKLRFTRELALILICDHNINPVLVDNAFMEIDEYKTSWLDPSGGIWS